MTPTTPASLTLRDVRVESGGDRLLSEIGLEILPGELVVVLGAGGAGKTILLRCIIGLQQLSAGAVLIDDRDITHRPVQQRDIVLMQQDYPLWPAYSVKRNVTLPLRHRGIDRKTRAALAESMLAALGLEEFQAHLPGQLNASRRQRVALARTLALQAPITLLDEPFADQGPQMRDQLLAYLRHHHDRQSGITMVATEDPGTAMRLADRIAVMTDGMIDQFDTPQVVYDRPDSRRVASSLGRVNLLPGEIEYAGEQPLFRSASGLVLPLFDHRLKRARQGWAMFRPHHVRLLDPNDPPFGELIRLNGFVTQVEFDGPTLHYAVEVARSQVWASLARADGTALPEVGDTLALGIDPAQVLILER